MEILDKEFIGLYNYHRETKGNDNENSHSNRFRKMNFQKKFILLHSILDSCLLFLR